MYPTSVTIRVRYMTWVKLRAYLYRD